MSNINNKLINISNYIKSLYKDELYDYYYIGPDDRKLLNKGNIVKYTNITDKEYKLKFGIIVNITINKLTLKSINSDLYWKIDFNKNHVFCLEKNKLKLLANEYM